MSDTLVTSRGELPKPTWRRLCWTDAKKLCLHGVRLDQPCTSCVEQADQKPFKAFDDVATEWREVPR